ncbi:DUF7848 domain-containing protein [Streptomyces laculatispora]|uniref:DUF7848 domain-containing protein n=1 Tax=Streptomyces laculatispora TaxID=887464 RepID=UPI001A9492C7|nr:hypothetical protein [Streptomyces laculatispora]MBO0917730.1 hypothetical protein [Streptomyces laculatispora]
MTIRSVIRMADWTIKVDRTPGASGPVYEVECTTCLEASDADERPRPPEDWALRHTGHNPGHRGYRAIITSFLRVTPAPGNPLHQEAP